MKIINPNTPNLKELKIRAAPIVAHQIRKYGFPMVRSTPDIIGEWEYLLEVISGCVILRNMPILINKRNNPPTKAMPAFI